MIQYFVILIHVRYAGKEVDWEYKKCDTYPTDFQIEDALRYYKDEKQYPTCETPTVYHARVEKRYELMEVKF